MFSCFAESPSPEKRGKTLKAFIFSLSNSRGLPPFKCLATEAHGAIFMRSDYGPSFGKRPFLSIASPKDWSVAEIDTPYDVPKEVSNIDRKHVLAGTDFFSPDNYEVFYLT